MSKVKLFVYGTFKEGEFFFKEKWVDSVVEKEDCVDGYSIFCSKSVQFPMLYEDSTGKAHGEVHEVAEANLKWFDYVESEGNYYKRVKATTNKGHEVYMYVCLFNKEKDFYKVEGQWHGKL